MYNILNILYKILNILTEGLQGADYPASEGRAALHRRHYRPRDHERRPRRGGRALRQGGRPLW